MTQNSWRSTLETRRGWTFALGLLVAIVLLIRARYLGNPVIHVDEEFYLLTGDRMLHGALPYLDIWDRKPVGLFLLYAAIRLLGGDGILQYQLVASGFVAATAVVIAILGRRIASPLAGIVAGIAYPLALGVSNGGGGQSPVFYNLPMAIAAALVVRAAIPGTRARAILWLGCGAMALVGLAIQIKYSALFEGVYFGLALLWLLWRSADRAMLALIGAGTAWVTLALLPTAAAIAYYARLGALHDFLFANFTSIGLREAVPAARQHRNLALILLRTAPFWICIAIGEAWRGRRPWEDRPAGRAGHHVLLGWLIASAAGLLAFGSYFDHYALPLIVPLAVMSAPAFALRRGHVGAVAIVAVLVTATAGYLHVAAKAETRYGDAAYAHRLFDAVQANLHGGCLYVFDGEPIIYLATHACGLTRWIFPYHLNYRREAPALGVDPAAEVARIMALHPSVVVDTIGEDSDINLDTQRVFRAAVARDYRPVAALRLYHDVRMVYALRPGIVPAGSRSVAGPR